MTWFTSSANQTAADASHAETVHFVQMDFASGALRLHTRTGTITWGGHDWLGIGQFGDISDISEDAMLRPQGVTFKLSGVDSAIISAARTEPYHGRAVTVYVGFLNVDTFQLVADPQVFFRGLLDVMTIELGANTGSVSVTAEGEIARWQRNNGFLYTSESQKQVWSNDLGYDNVGTIQMRAVNWEKRRTWGVTWSPLVRRTFGK